jgi:hypothetical protein
LGGDAGAGLGARLDAGLDADLGAGLGAGDPLHAVAALISRMDAQAGRPALQPDVTPGPTRLAGRGHR